MGETLNLEYIIFIYTNSPPTRRIFGLYGGKYDFEFDKWVEKEYNGELYYKEEYAKRPLLDQGTKVLFIKTLQIRKENKVELTKDRINEIAYAMLIVNLSEQSIQFNPQQFKRKLGNLPQKLKFLPEQFRDFSKEEIQEALKAIAHDLVNYSFGFSWKDKDEKKEKKV